jgi:glycopeptide antibiotics resistance protein
MRKGKGMKKIVRKSRQEKQSEEQELFCKVILVLFLTSLITLCMVYLPTGIQALWEVLNAK